MKHMTITHHLSDDLLMAYSAGALPEALSLVVATHVSMCPDCRAALAAHDAVGGAVLGTCGEAELAPDSLEKTLARIAAAPPETPRPKRDDSLPGPLADYVGGSLSQVKWRALAGGVKQAVLPTDRGATARLLYIPGGVAVPDHGHRGVELTLVLQGAFRDETGRFGPGDIEVASDDLEHKPVAEHGPACICLAATEAPLRFAGLIPRLMQPLFRI